MSALIPYVALGIAGIVAFYLFKTKNSVKDPPEVTDRKNSCISVPSAGGFDRLCHTDAPYGTIGANIPGISVKQFNESQILRQHPSKYDINNLIQVEVHAFGLNYADCCVRWGLYSSAKEFVGWPITPGFEFSGTIKWIADKNSKFKIGDEVFGLSMFGSYSTAITVPEHQLFHKPNTLNMSEAAGFLCTAITAYYATFGLAAPTMIPYIHKSVINHTNTFHGYQQNNGVQIPAQYVLIHSASGGVGSMLAQMCKQVAGFTCVIGVVGGQHKVAIAKQMGCDVVIDRKSKHLENGNIWDEIKKKVPEFDGFDVIFDANGVATLKKSYECLKPTGRLVVYGFHTMLPHSGSISPLQWIKLGINAVKTPSFNPMKLVEQNKAIFGFNLSFLFSRTDIIEIGMANILEWVQNDQIKVSKVTEYKMSDVGKAHEDIQSGNTIGKLVMITAHHKNYNK